MTIAKELIDRGIVLEPQREALEKYFKMRRRFDGLFGGHPNETLDPSRLTRSFDRYFEARERLENELESVFATIRDLEGPAMEPVRFLFPDDDRVTALGNSFREVARLSGIPFEELVKHGAYREIEEHIQRILKLMKALRAELNACDEAEGTR